MLVSRAGPLFVIIQDLAVALLGALGVYIVNSFGAIPYG